GNTETKKVQKTLLKQQFENFSGSNSEGLDQIHDRLQKLVSQLEIHGVSLSQTYVHLKNSEGSNSEGLVSPNIHSLSCGDQIRIQGDKTENTDKGKSPVVTITGFRDLNAEFEECHNNSSNGANAASFLVSAAGQNYTNNTNDFSAAGLLNADMSNLDDISQDADDVVGAEADINNMESTISVSPIPTTRIHKDHPTSQIIGDLSSTTQTRTMARAVKDQGGISQMFNEDFHTCMFACFLSQEEPKRVLVDLPYGKRAIGTKWVYRNKKDERGIIIRNKAMLVAQGHTQEKGIDYEEVFAPVARIEAIRLFLAYASFMGFPVYQMDVKSAFLYGTIEEELYVCQPPGFEDQAYPDKVYKVVKALYGLHQAPRAWYETLATYLLENGFQRGTIDQTLFIKKQQENILLVQIYVDDIIFGATNKALCQSFEKLMKDKFQMSSMGELTFFLGLQVKQNKDVIFISQDKYVAEILKKFGLFEEKSASTPIDAEKPLLKDLDGEDVDVHTYRSMIGSLMYLTSSRPDIMFVVCACARFQVTPKVSHLNAVKRIFRYLKGKPYLGLWYPKDSPFDLVAYSDSDYAVVATSSTKAEYVAAASGCAQVLWMQNQLLDYGDSPLLGVNLTRSDEDRLKLMELMVFLMKRDVCDELGLNVARLSKFLLSGKFMNSLFADSHNMLDILEKSDAAEGFEQIIDFLSGSYINHALTVNPHVYISCIKQFWNTAVVKRSGDVTRVEGLEHDKVAQQLEIVKLKERVKKLEKINKGRIIVDMDQDEGIELVADQEKDAEFEGRHADKQAEIYNIDLDHSSKVLSMQEEDDKEVQEAVEIVTTAKLMTEVVTAAASQVSAVNITIPTELPSDTPAESPKVKDKGKGILIEAPKPMKKKDQIVLDAEYAKKLHEEINKDDADFNKDIDWAAALDHVQSKNPPQYIKRYHGIKRKPQTESECHKNMMFYLKNIAGYKMSFFKGLTYDEILPIFQARFDANMRFLLKSREEMEEQDQEALKSINETLAQKAAKRRKLHEQAKEDEYLMKQLEIIHDEDDDVFIEATPLGRKVPVVNYEIVMINNKPRYKIIRADDTHQLYISFITLLKNFDREDLENL
nr:putative ribonuclease H-like domain-containing protein [Tanacetum cinerariifolium]